jgi:hypothetical protein
MRSLLFGIILLASTGSSSPPPAPAPAPAPAPRPPPPPGYKIVHQPNGELLIIFLFMGLGLGACSLHVLTRTKRQIPYALVIFTEGLLFGFIMNHFEDGINIHCSFCDHLQCYYYRYFHKFTKKVGKRKARSTSIHVSPCPGSVILS